MWRSSRQATVTTSSTHAEVTAASEFSQSLMWAREFMGNLGMTQPTTRVMVDNKAVCDQNVSGHELRKAEHYRSKQVWLEQCVRQLHLWLDHTSGDENPADIFTKATAVKTFQKHRDRILGFRPEIPLSETSHKIFDKGRDRYVNGGHGGHGESGRS